MKKLFLFLFLAISINAQIAPCNPGNTKAMLPCTGTSYAIRFRHDKFHNVYAGRLWNPGEVYEDFYFDSLVKPTRNAEYIFSAGYGGLHNLLVGFGGGQRMSVTGNVSTATAQVDGPAQIYSGVDTIGADEWCHIAVARVNGYIITFVNGVPSFKHVKADGRMSTETFEVDAYIGGSDHSNFEGLIRYVRLFENTCPIYVDPTSGRVIRVEQRPRVSYWNDVHNRIDTANLLLDFSFPGETIKNLGVPLITGNINDGVRNGQMNSFGFGNQYVAVAEEDLPQWEATVVRQTPTKLVPSPMPAGAKIFDSFKRNDVVYLWQNNLGLGHTETGSLGILPWQEVGFGTGNAFGILSGRAYSAGVSDAIRTYVQSDSPVMKVQVGNHGNEFSGAELFGSFDFTAQTGLKAIDSGNIVSLYKVEAGAIQQLGYYVKNPLVPYTMGVQYTADKHISLLYNGASVIDYDDSTGTALTGTQAGFASTSAFVRFEDFGVY
jgi:hypothetical protein